LPEPTWKELSEKLGVTPVTMSKWRSNDSTCPRDSKKLEDWKKWLQKKELSGKGSGRVAVDGREYSASDIQDLKAKLIAAQERRENAMAQIREIELQQKRDNLIPESEATEKLIKLLTPLRRLLDALPRQISAQANPSNPNIAELAIRNGLDDRVFAEIEKIMKDNDAKI
jgi:transcriptional regulator with XRE-family HTH domain|tara:strand:- start:1448 stop:1957 length:510 start_codon:yes stop_codon:yes gene_type:complete